MPKIKIFKNHTNHIFSKMILKCESCIESWIFPTFFDWLLFIPESRSLKHLKHFWCLCKLTCSVTGKFLLLNSTAKTWIASSADTLFLNHKIRVILRRHGRLKQSTCIYIYEYIFYNVWLSEVNNCIRICCYIFKNFF